jgi:hypothetical protein
MGLSQGDLLTLQESFQADRYQLANHRVSPSPEIPQPTSQPLTRPERQAVLEISELLGINVRIGNRKTNQRRVTS